MRRNLAICLVLGACAAIVAAGLALDGARRRNGAVETGAVVEPGAAVKPTAADRAPLYWYDPMRPDVHFDKPGKSPFMDMMLVPKFGDQTAPAPDAPDGAPAGSIAIDPRVVQNLGIRLANVERGDFSRIVDTVGLVAVDEHRIEAVQVREPGWVERLEVRAVGDAVRRGQLLAGVFSPDLLATQQEFLIARDAGDPALIEAARRRLALFGLSDSQLARIQTTGQVERRVEYRAPFDGYVMDLGVREGAAVDPGTTLFQLAELSSVWIIAEVPETEAAWVVPGDRVESSVAALPGRHFEGHVDYIYPDLTPSTRTLKMRMVIDNPHHALRPGMFATARLRGTPLTQTLTVPTEAVIKTGTRSIVMVADDATHFRPALVRIGVEQGGRSQILEGLKEGQRIVASGEFLLDSEANMRGALGALAGAP
jgi:Cu(I)/Ag(I) efflux system membrane fusion protein